MLRRARAFTLIELLVVIGVIAIVIGVLLPALSGARQSAMQLQCATNLRQWSHALHMYIEQSGGWLPRRGQGTQPTANVSRPDDWFNALPLTLHQRSFADLVSSGIAPAPGGGTIWVCPAAGSDGVGKHFFAYGMNMGLSTWSTATPDKANALGPWSTMVFMSDAPGSFCSVWPAGISGGALPQYAPAARHRKRMNVAFIDGHVASLLPGEAYAIADDAAAGPDTQTARWLVPRSPWTGPKSN